MRSLSKCNRLYTTRKGFQPDNYKFRSAWNFSTFALKTIQKTQHHQYVFARKDLVEISVRLVESILAIQIHARMERPAHRLEAEKMTLNVPAFLASLDVSATAVIKSFLENQSTKFEVQTQTTEAFEPIFSRFITPYRIDLFFQWNLDRKHRWSSIENHIRSNFCFIPCTG